MRTLSGAAANAMDKICVVADAAGVYRTAAQRFVREATHAVARKGRFDVALCGGATPRGLYSLLADDAQLLRATPWPRTHVFWGDERHVPPDDADSNYRMARESMLDRVPVPPGNVHRIPAEQPDAEQAALDYAQELRRSFGLRSGERPRFDLILLGLGADGHTASLFPGSAALDERRRLVVAARGPGRRRERITLTVPVLNDAACIVFLVVGRDKATIVKAVLDGPREPRVFPAQWIDPTTGRLLWIIDRQAASLLDDDAQASDIPLA